MNTNIINLENYRQPNILFLRGCFLSNCNSIEDIFDEQLVNQSMDSYECYSMSDTVYDKIPRTFNNVSSWIIKTNLKCWSCDSTFQTPPIFIPNTLEQPCKISDKYGNMEVLGNFCSWNCASQYINLHFNGAEKWEKHQLLKLLYEIFTGKTIDFIVPAPPKTEMKQYGGKKTKQEYMELLVNLNDAYHIALEHNQIENISK